MREIPAELDAKLASGGEGLTLLVIRLGAMGDIVRTVPALRLLRRALPHSQVHWIMDPPWIQLLDGDRDLASCLRFPRKELGEAHFRTMRSLRRELRALKLDAVHDIHGNLRSGAVGRLTGARTRFGYDGHQQKEGNRWLTTHRLASGPRRTPRIDRNLELPTLLGIEASPAATALDGDLPIFDLGRTEAVRLIAELGLSAKKFAIVSPGASVSQAYKRPPAEFLAAAARRAVAGGLRPLVVWGPGEQPDAEAVCAALGKAEWLAPATSLPVLAALIRLAGLFVGGDSGPMHLACAAATPVVAVYGPTDPIVNGPWGTEHETVAGPDERYTGLKRHDREGKFQGIEANAVAAAVDRLLPRIQTGSTRS